MDMLGKREMVLTLPTLSIDLLFSQVTLQPSPLHRKQVHSKRSLLIAEMLHLKQPHFESSLHLQRNHILPAAW